MEFKLCLNNSLIVHDPYGLSLMSLFHHLMKKVPSNFTTGFSLQL